MIRDELRDRLAELTGWMRRLTTPANRPVWEKDDGVWMPHPFPNNDLTALAKAWDTEPLKGWYWGKCWGEMVAQKRSTQVQVCPVKETGNFYHDWLTLTVAVLEHERGAGNTTDAGRGKK